MLTWENPGGETPFEMPTGGTAIMRAGPNLLKLARKDMAENIKLGPGGIREIEFIAQAFQIVRGGRRPELRERSLMRVLPLLAGALGLPFMRVNQFLLRSNEFGVGRVGAVRGEPVACLRGELVDGDHCARRRRMRLPRPKCRWARRRPFASSRSRSGWTENRPRSIPIRCGSTRHCRRAACSGWAEAWRRCCRGRCGCWACGGGTASAGLDSYMTPEI